MGQKDSKQLGKALKHPENKKAVKQVFDSFDQDKNGTLSLDEFKKFLHVLQNSETTFLDLSKIPTSDFDLFAQTLFDKVDLQHGNKIIFDDFVSFLKNPPTISASDLCPQQDIKPEAKPEAKPEIKQKRKLLAFSSLEESDIKVTETKLNTKLWHQWGDCVLATLDDKPVFIKKIYHPKDHGQNLDTFQRDIEIMAQLPSAFFEKIYGFCLSEAFVVSEYFPTGSLQDLFEASTGPCFEWKPAIRFLQAVAQGISTLHHHDPPLLHLELKPSRILLTQDKQPRLCALDMSRFSNRLVCQKPAKHMIHTPPEVLAGNECSPASDIYSFGPLVLQLVQGCISGKYANLIPEDMLIPYMFFSKVLKEQWRPEIMNGVPSCCQELVLACWPQEPKERISIETVLEKLDSIGEEFIREGQNWPKFE